MRYSTLICHHTAEVPCKISCEQECRFGMIVKSAPSRLENETQKVADRLLREYFTQIGAHRPSCHSLTP
jgi:hypothetical protein